MFLGHLYMLLDQCQILEKNATGTMGVETLLNSGFLQVFLWEHIKGLDVCPLPYSRALQSADMGNGSFMPDSLPLVCRWFKRMQRKGQKFLGLLDDIEYFIFRPYGTLAETFTFVPFYADVDDVVEVPAVMSQGCCFRRYSLLNVACLPLPTLGDSRSEISVIYSPHRVRRQLGLNQGVPANPNHGDPLLLHRVFWGHRNIPDSARPPFLAGKRRIGGFSPGYQAYWNCCLASLHEFQSSPCDRLPLTTARLAGLVSEEKAIPLSVKRNLPFISKSGKQKREEKPSAKKEQAAGKPRRFIPKVASSGPPRTKEVTPPARPQPSEPAASESQGRAGKVLESTPLCRKMGTTPKRKRSDTTPVTPHTSPKRRSMRIRQARFTGVHARNSEASGAGAVVTIDDDSDDDDATETEASVPKQEDVDDMDDIREDFGKGDHYNHAEDAFVHSSNYPEEQGGSDAFTDSSVRRINIESIIDVTDDPNLAVVAAADPTQSAQEVPIAHSAYSFFCPFPKLGMLLIVWRSCPWYLLLPGTFDSLVEVALAESSSTIVPASSPDKASMSQAASPLSPIIQHLLRRNLEPDLSPTLPAAFQSKTFTFHGTLPASSHIQPLLRILGSSSPALLPLIPFDNAVTDGEALANDIVTEVIPAGHSSNTSWLEWERSFIAFRAFFDSGVQVLRSADELLPLCH
ncbi:uncharacterized protein Pyn_17871 [Prunus yedoensis var. nudiflora]|uniref:Aminotransferase-like plant mobile domain-containing protein n=1 Tax=Prunus yedoensis var. nudiflora TaxID=2094558 RepID=A0A314UX71_PRUYE|nr:uncharacterized protein Pyn_17871 [Prunus yedoensis var. nudiflora]